MRDHRKAFLGSLLVLFAGCGGGGQLEQGGGTRKGGGGGGGSGNTTDLGEFVVLNTSTAEGPAVAEVVVPLMAGQHTDVPYVITQDKAPCQVFPMGPRYVDGSLRYLRIEAPVSVQPNERKTVALSATDQEPPAFTKHSSITDTIGVGARFRVGDKEHEFSKPELIESGPLTKVYRSRCRATGSMLWAEWIVCIYSDTRFAKFTLQWGNSDPSNPNLYEDPGQVEFRVAGPAVEWEQPWKILKEGNASHWRLYLLHDGGQISDGQSQILEGRFLYEGHFTPPRVFAVHKDWAVTGTFGPFGFLVPEIPVDPQDFQNLIQEENRLHRNHPWARCVHGCNPDPSNTGYQNDFGSTMMRADVLLADPGRFPTILRSIYQEACRATHHRETDVSRVTVANHPKLLTLDGRPKLAESRDLLGKRKDNLKTTMKGPSGERWLGHDTEHLSINYLAAMALLTGNRFARDEVDHHCELYLSGFTHKSGSYNDSPGPARKVGRSSLAALWMWLVTGRDKLRVRLINRTDDVLKKMNSYHLNFKVVAPRGTYWVPWEEGMAVTGLYAVFRHFATPSALDLINQVTTSIAFNGMAKLPDGQWRCGYELPWRFKDGSDYFAQKDPNFPSIAAGNGLTTWCIPSIFIGAEHHPVPAVKERCLQIIRERHGRVMGGLDSELDWICVSPNIKKLAGMR